jgi:sphinganine-1-phosphate aldolase
MSNLDRILPETAHTAFHKAAEYFKIKMHLVSCKLPSYKAHASSFARLVNSNTVLLVASAPNYPHGIIDDISSLSKLAAKRRIPLHVDCCLGSFLIPYLEKAGFRSEPFDFKLKGVTSISCDTHKYGFAPKGSSTLLYRTEDLRSYQYFISPNWPGGVYASPSMAGSRPGSLIAGTWASMMAQGENGYIDACHKIIGTARNLESAIREDPDLNVDLRVIGRPLLSVVAFASSTIDIYAVADGMSSKGWHLNALQNPPAVHVAVTLPMVPAWEQLVADLKDVISDIVEKEKQAIATGKAIASRGDASALYGVAGSLPTKAVVEELARSFLDILYKA